MTASSKMIHRHRLSRKGRSDFELQEKGTFDRIESIRRNGLEAKRAIERDRRRHQGDRIEADPCVYALSCFFNDAQSQ